MSFKYFKILLQICLIYFSLFFLLPASENQITCPELDLARKYDVNEPGDVNVKNRDLAVEHYKKALLQIKDDITRIKIEYRTGILLSQIVDSKNRQGIKVDESLEYFERLTNQYRYEDVFRKSQIVDPSSLNFNDSAELIMPSAAILAGDQYLYRRNKGEQARLYYTKTMNEIKFMYERQLLDWKKYIADTEERIEFKKKDRKSIDIEALLRGPNSSPESQQLALISKMEDMKKKIATGDVFSNDSDQMLLTKAAIKKYVASYGPMDLAMIPGILNKIISDYPNTPISKAAQEYYNSIASKIQSKILKEGNKLNISLKNIDLKDKNNVQSKSMIDGKRYIPATGMEGQEKASVMSSYIKILLLGSGLCCFLFVIWFFLKRILVK